MSNHTFPLPSPLSSSSDYPQTVAVWDWASGKKEPVATYTLGPEIEFQHFIKFNPADVRDIVSNGLKQIVFWVWTGKLFIFICVCVCFCF
jgi:hypothetical protein